MGALLLVPNSDDTVALYMTQALVAASWVTYLHGDAEAHFIPQSSGEDAVMVSSGVADDRSMFLFGC